MVLSLGCTGAALAQTNGFPDPTPEIRRHELRQEQLRRELEHRPNVRMGEAAVVSHAALPRETPCRVLVAVDVDGPDMLEPVLQRALGGVRQDDAPQGRCIGAQGIAVLMERTRNALIAHGYITSRIEAPSQDLSQGRLRLRVMIGRVSAIDKGAGASSIRHLAPLAAGAPLQLRDIEQSLENLRRNPSVQADFQLQPGSESDSTEIVLDYSHSRPLRLHLSLDDSGSTATGKLMSQATVSWDNPLGLSDLVYVSDSQDVGHRQAGPRGNDSQTFHYSVPWGYWLWSFSASRGGYRQTIAGAFQSYLFSGETHSQDFQISRLVHRDAHSKTSVQFKGFTRRSSNYIDDTEVQVQRRQTAGWEAAFQHQRRAGSVVGDLSLSFRRGTGAFGAQPAPEERFGEGSSRMQVGVAAVNLQWPLPVPMRLSANHHLRMQFNHSPLVPQDRLCLGGRYSVRGFDGRQVLCGDRGYLVRNELAWSLDERYALYLAADAGRVSGRSAQELPQRFMAGYAVGWRASARLAREVALSLDGFVSRPISKPEFLTTSATSAGFSMSLNF